MSRSIKLLAFMTAAALAATLVVAHAQTPNGARAAGAVRGPNGAAAAQRGVVTDDQGHVEAGSASGFTTANGSQGKRTTRFSRTADGNASAERNTSATNANTGVTFDGSTTYTKGEGVSRSGSCRDANGNTVTCGSGR